MQLSEFIDLQTVNLKRHGLQVKNHQAAARSRVAQAIGISKSQLRNMLSAGTCGVERLADGRYVVITLKTKIFELGE